MKEKLRSSGGMTLTELLVALAIVALIGMSLTLGVGNAAKIYRDATRVFEAETLCGTILTYLEDEFRFSRNIQVKTVAGAEPEVVFDSQVFGKDVKVLVEDGKVKIKGESSEFDLLSNKAYTSGLKVNKDESKISYDKDTGLVTIKIAVGSDDTGAYVNHTVTVAPVDD